MAHPYALSMTKPHECLGLPQPIGRRIPQGISGWNMAIVAATVALVGFYVFQVNSAATKSYRLRGVEKRVEALKMETSIRQNKLISQSSLGELSAKASELGFVPVEKIEFMNPNPSSYALAR